MNNIRRYSPFINSQRIGNVGWNGTNQQVAAMSERVDGDWVKYGDHLAALEVVRKERDELKAHLEEAEMASLGAVDLMTTAEKERDEAKAAFLNLYQSFTDEEEKARKAGLTFTTVREILNQYEAGEASFSKVVELIRIVAATLAKDEVAQLKADLCIARMESEALPSHSALEHVTKERDRLRSLLTRCLPHIVPTDYEGRSDSELRESYPHACAAIDQLLAEIEKEMRP